MKSLKNSLAADQSSLRTWRSSFLIVLVLRHPIPGRRWDDRDDHLIPTSSPNGSFFIGDDLMEGIVSDRVLDTLDPLIHVVFARS